VKVKWFAPLVASWEEGVVMVLVSTVRQHEDGKSATETARGRMMQAESVLRSNEACKGIWKEVADDENERMILPE
jgi:hypothetical protein